MTLIEQCIAATGSDACNYWIYAHLIMWNAKALIAALWMHGAFFATGFVLGRWLHNRKATD